MEDESGHHWNYWHNILVNSAQCASILDRRKRFERETLKNICSDHILRKAVLAITLTFLASTDSLDASILQENVFDVFDPTGPSLPDWQADLIVCTLIRVNDVSSPKDFLSSPNVAQDDILPHIQQRLEEVLDQSGNSSSTVERRLLGRCEEVRSLWLELYEEGSSFSSNVEVQHRQGTVALIQKHMPAIMESLAFDEFVQRQEEAMRFVFQPALEPPVQAGSDEAEPSAQVAKPENMGDGVAASQNTPSALAMKQPTPMGLTQPTPAPASTTINSVIPQTLRTSYDAARLAAHTRALQRKRPPSPTNPSNRKIWSNDEENALLEGLEYVRGPHWSQILALYGEAGLRGDVLKSRSQVQLKDKARNMKLFFVKHGLEVPEILKNVTGELKKGRGGGGEEPASADGVEEGEANVQTRAALLVDAGVREDESSVSDSLMPATDSLETEPPDRMRQVELMTAIAT